MMWPQKLNKRHRDHQGAIRGPQASRTGQGKQERRRTVRKEAVQNVNLSLGFFISCGSAHHVHTSLLLSQIPGAGSTNLPRGRQKIGQPQSTKGIGPQKICNIDWIHVARIPPQRTSVDNPFPRPTSPGHLPIQGDSCSQIDGVWWRREWWLHLDVKFPRDLWSAPWDYLPTGPCPPQRVIGKVSAHSLRLSMAKHRFNPTSYTAVDRGVVL